MPSVKLYKNAKELSLSPEDMLDFVRAVNDFKGMLASHGIAQQAIDLISFELSAWMLTTENANEFHVHANGKPLYELTIKAPFEYDESCAPPANAIYYTDLSTKQQAATICLADLGHVLLPEMGKVLHRLNPHIDEKDAGGVSCSFAPMTITTTFQNIGIERYMACMTMLMSARLTTQHRYADDLMKVNSGTQKLSTPRPPSP